MHIPVSEPIIEKDEIKNVVSALQEKAISGLYGEYISKFESEFARYCQCLYGISTNSGTTALHLALAALGIDKDDEVLVSTFTNMATFFAVLYQGAKPIPIDIEPDTWNINPELIEERITRNTKAILVVHIYGHPCDMGPILATARKYGLFVVEDCAEAHGATYKGRKAGSFGDIGCFSFYANKIITTGEGGMLTTNNKRIAEKARSLKSLAFGRKNKFMHQDIGYGYRMTNIQAAIGWAQFKKIERIIGMKREIAQFYNVHLSDVPGLKLPVEKSYARNVYWMYHVVLNDKFDLSRNSLMQKLKDCGIETRESFTPFNMQRIFIKQGLTKLTDCPIANDVARNGFYLPSGPRLNKTQLKYIVDTIKHIYKDHK